MCEQCASDTKVYAILSDKEARLEVVPNFALIRATAKGNLMQPDDWGLLYCDDPEVVWKKSPTEDPGINSGNNAWLKDAEEFQKLLTANLSPYMSWLLVQESMGLGYSWEKHGKLGHWLWGRMGNWLKKATPLWLSPGVTDKKLEGLRLVKKGYVGG